MSKTRPNPPMVPVLALALLLSLLAPALAVADDLRDLSSRASASKIAPELLAQLAADVDRSVADDSELPTYRVVVDLRPSDFAPALGVAFADAGSERAMRDDVRRVQDRVLATMGRRAGEHMSVWNRYQSTHGFSAIADARGIDELTKLDDVLYVHELPIYYKQDAEAHAITNVDNAHAGGDLGAGVTIAVIDDGIDHDHPAFGGQSAYPNSKILGGRDFADNDNNPRVDCTGQSHGTSVSGVAAGDGGGVVGAAPDAKIVFLKIQGASICGQPALNGDIPGAIDWAVTNRNNFTPPIKIISMSLGTTSTFTNPCSSIAESGALGRARSAGMVTLVASGNSAASNGISSPACHPDAVSVGATYDTNLGGVSFSNCSDSSTFADKVTCYSNSDTFLDLLGPSHCAFTAQTGGGNTSCFGGTSSATPYAAGVTALLFGKDSSLSRSDAIDALKNGGVSITDGRNGISKPRVNATASLALVGGGGGGGGTCNGTNCIDWDNTGTVSYSNQDSSGNVAVQDGGDTIRLQDNTWRRTTQTFNITANTVVEFDFRSTSQGEIHGLGFDADDGLSSDRIFKVHGTQTWGISNFDNYTSGTTTYTIPVGTFFTGNNMRLVLVNDNDAGSGNNSFFSNVRVFESGGGGGGCSVEVTFESGAEGWTNAGSSTCSTGSFVSATPTVVNNGGVTTQVGGAHGGSRAFFSATNSSAGVNDVDGGECVVLSPVYSVSEASSVSAWYFHGQRDAGDDSGDFFRLEISTNGGSSWTNMASYNDQQVNASWTEATASVSAGASVRFRVRVADGTSNGDLIEAGVDDIKICGN
ncbi:MAG: S8 family serine peptidase [Acidobacteriota bacterium]